MGKDHSNSPSGALRSLVRVSHIKEIGRSFFKTCAENPVRKVVF